MVLNEFSADITIPGNPSIGTKSPASFTTFCITLQNRESFLCASRFKAHRPSPLGRGMFCIFCHAASELTLILCTVGGPFVAVVDLVVDLDVLGMAARTERIPPTTV